MIVKSVSNPILYLFLAFCFISKAQIPITAAEVNGITNAAEGDYYLTTDTDELYLALSNGQLKPVGNVTAKGTADNQYLSWNNTTNSWQVNAPSTGGLTATSRTITATDRARIGLAGVSNINAATVNALTPLSFQLNEMGATINGNNISNLEGNLRFIVYPNLVSTGSVRTNFNCNFLVNGAIQETLFTGLYGRNQEGHTDTGGAIIFEFENATTTDEFSFTLSRETTPTSAVALLNTSKILIDQYARIDVITAVSAPIDLNIVQGPAGPAGPTGPQGPAGPPIQNPTDVYHATGSVLANGTANYIQGATVARIGVGTYRVTFTEPHDNGGNYPILFSMEQNAGEDDYVPSYNNVTATSFDVEIGEQDNGGTAGVRRDAGFSFYVPL